MFILARSVGGGLITKHISIPMKRDTILRRCIRLGFRWTGRGLYDAGDETHELSRERQKEHRRYDVEDRMDRRHGRGHVRVRRHAVRRHGVLVVGEERRSQRKDRGDEERYQQDRSRDVEERVRKRRLWMMSAWFRQGQEIPACRPVPSAVQYGEARP